MPSIQETLGRLIAAARAKGSASPWKGQCPNNHKGKTPCLSIGTDDGHIWMKCHRGCDLDAICAGFGIVKADLYPQANPKYEIEDIYDYRDERGALLYQTVRKRLADPAIWPNADLKQIYQRRPDGAGGGIRGVRRVLYRLPELIASKDSDATVFIVEGEKCVEALRIRGLIATCNPMGAGKNKWLAEFSKFLISRDVVILPDNDDPGREHAQRVAAALYGKARSVRVLELWRTWREMPEKGDVFDWLESEQHYEDELAAMVEACPEWAPVDPKTNGHKPIGLQAVCMADVQIEPVEWLWEKRIPLKLITILQGIEGVGKSTLIAAVVAAVTIGKGLPDMNVSAPANVLWLSAEDDLSMMLKPRLLAAGADVSRVFAIGDPFTLDENGVELLRREATAYKPVLIIIDPLFAYTYGDPCKGSDARPITNELKKIAEEFRCALILVRHVGKSKGFGDPRSAGLYSVEWQAAARSVLLAGCDPDQPSKRALTQTKNNLSEIAVSIEYSIKSDPDSPSKARFYWGGVSDLTARRILETIATDDETLARKDAEEFLRQILASGALPVKDIQAEARANGISERTLDRAKSRLRIKSHKLDKKGPWHWSLREEASTSEGCQISESGTLQATEEGKENNGEKSLKGANSQTSPPRARARGGRMPSGTLQGFPQDKPQEGNGIAEGCHFSEFGTLQERFFDPEEGEMEGDIDA